MAEREIDLGKLSPERRVFAVAYQVAGETRPFRFSRQLDGQVGVSVALMTAGKDPNIEVDEESYLRGAADALTSVITGMRKVKLSSAAEVVLQRENAMNTLRILSEIPGTTIRDLKDVFGIADDELKKELRILQDVGFITPAHPTSGSGRAYELSEWGVEVFANLEAEKRKQELMHRIEVNRQNFQNRQTNS